MWLTVYNLPAIYPSLVFGLFVILTVFVLAVWLMKRRRRQEILSEWSTRIGFSYEATLSAGENSRDVLLAPLRMSGLLKELTKLMVRNIMRGRFEGHEWLIFDMQGWRKYRYAESDPIQWTVTIMLTEEYFPTLHIEPVVPMFSRLHPDRSSAIKTGDKEFNRHFMVFGKRLSAEHILNQDLREYLLGLTRASKRWYRHLYLHDNMIIVVEATLAPPRHIEDMIKIVLGVRKRIPVSVDN